MTSSEALMFRDVVVGFIENETRTTARVIAAVPDSNRHYKPDERSRSGWEIAAHIALSDVWFAGSITRGEFNWAGEPPLPPEFTSPDEVSRWYMEKMGECFATLRKMTSEQLTKEVDFFGRKAPAVLWLLMMMSHTVHHRGQLAGYLRAAGGRVPAIYGVSADENLFGT
jgi:uncharacterized damage-inducible protein DinB